MKRIILCAVVLCAMLAASAKETPPAIGFGLADSAGNLGISLEISSASFARDFLTFKLESQVDVLSAYRDSPYIAWETFFSHRLGLVATGGWNTGALRLYGEFGALAVQPPASLSADRLQWGIYGLFGYEFFMDSEQLSPVSYYLEAGTNSLFDRAEKLPGKSDYYSGFTIRTGLRWYF